MLASFVRGVGVGGSCHNVAVLLVVPGAVHSLHVHAGRRQEEWETAHLRKPHTGAVLQSEGRREVEATAGNCDCSAQPPAEARKRRRTLW